MTVKIDVTELGLPRRRDLTPGTFFIYESDPKHLLAVPANFGWREVLSDRDIMLTAVGPQGVYPEESRPEAAVIVVDLTATRSPFQALPRGGRCA